jgi:hypothetical protein
MTHFDVIVTNEFLRDIDEAVFYKKMLGNLPEKNT